MARFTCTNCGYSVEEIQPSGSDLSCPGCRHRLETEGGQDGDIHEHEHIFFDELMSGRTAQDFYHEQGCTDEAIQRPDKERVQYSSSSEAPAAPGCYGLRFDGSAGGYFRVWIVNVVLSIMTLGIFMIWVKKRARKYFTEHMTLAGYPMDSPEKRETVYEYITGGSPGNAAGGDLTIQSTAKSSRLFWIRFSNLLAVIASLGLLIPWAKVRKVRYMISNTTVIPRRVTGEPRMGHRIGEVL